MITENMRKSFHEAANGAIEAVQAMLKANPEMLPTDAYRLAIEFMMELYVTSYFMQLEFVARHMRGSHD